MTDARQFIERTLDPLPQTPKLPWYQLRFSLQALLLLMTMLAVASAIAFSFPPAVAAVVCITLQPCLVAAFISGALVAKEELRFFCIGALVPVAQSVMAGMAGGGNWGYVFALMNSGQIFAGQRGTADQSAIEYLGQLSMTLGRIGRPMMVNLLAFCFIAICSGYSAVWIRRFVLNRNVQVEPKSSLDTETSQSKIGKNSEV